jgi:hypothetical protein
MRPLLLCSGVAVAALGVACTLTADLGGLAGDEADGGATDSPIVAPDGSGPPADGAAPDAPADASDPSKAYAATVLADGPVAYFRFEEPSDANAAKDEISGLGATSTGPGVGFGSAGVRGRGATFSGTDWLDFGDRFDFAGLEPFTLEVWLRPIGGVASGILFHKRYESEQPFKSYVLYAAGDGTPHFEAWGVDLSAWNATPLPMTFSHVVLAVRYASGKGNATLYVNGQPATSGGFDNITPLADTPQHLRFGTDVRGVLDELAIYDKALPADRILEHYRAGR